MRPSKLMLGFLLSLLSGVDTAAAATPYVTLYTWYSETRGDHFSTTQPEWAAALGARRRDGGGSGYQLLRIEGRLFSPALPQPPNTLPVYSLWNAERADNFLTSQTEWVNSTNRDGYSRFRLEGYVFDRPRSGTLPLISYWSGARADNYVTTDPRLQLPQGQPALERTPSVRGGNYSAFRVEGYILPNAPATETDDPAFAVQLTEAGFGDWRPLAPSEHGVRQTDPFVRGARIVTTPMVIVAVEFGGLTFSARDEERYRAFAAPAGDLSFAAASQQLSGGKYRLTPVTYVGKVRDPITADQLTKMASAAERFRNGQADLFRRENGFSIDVYDLDRNGVTADELEYRARVLKLMNGLVDFSTFDANRDGRVDTSELLVLRFGADRGNGGQYGLPQSVSLDGRSVSAPVLLVAAETTRCGLMHEALHAWGGTDVYGPCYGCFNQGASLMAAMSWTDEMWQLDAWHRLKFGWSLPRFIPIGRESAKAGGFASLQATGHNGSVRALAYYDPARGLSEYFLVEFRSPFPHCDTTPLPSHMCPNYMDAGTPDIGLAVWHVRTNSSRDLFQVRRSDDPRGRYAWRPTDQSTAQTASLGVQGPGSLIGTVRYLKPTDGELALRWFDGADTGLRLRAAGMTETSTVADVLWREQSAPLAPRLDALLVTGFAVVEYPRIENGSYFGVDGQFGRRSEPFAAVVVAADGTRHPVTIEAEAPSRMVLGIPRGTPAGRYQLVLGPRSAIARWELNELSNALKLEVPVARLALDLKRLTKLRETTLGTFRVDLAKLGILPNTTEPSPQLPPPQSAQKAAPVGVYDLKALGVTKTVVSPKPVK